jgi:protein ImuB
VAVLPALAEGGKNTASWPAGSPRPIRLLVPPEPVEATAPVPDDPPILFRWRRLLHRVRRADGPERIAAEWWRAADPIAHLGASDDIRDYYRVEDESGRRFWLFRAGLFRPGHPAHWFVHGVFA